LKNRQKSRKTLFLNSEIPNTLSYSKSNSEQLFQSYVCKNIFCLAAKLEKICKMGGACRHFSAIAEEDRHKTAFIELRTHFQIRFLTKQKIFLQTYD